MPEDYSGQNLRGRSFKGQNLEGVNFRGADIRDADFSDANLSRANLSTADLSGADLYGTNLSRTDLKWADLSRVDLSGANLSEAKLFQADLRGANLSGANFSWAKLFQADLNGANLSEADLRGANLIDANLNGANLSGTNLSGANLIDADLNGADLGGAQLRMIQALGTNFTGANFTGACIEDWNINSATNLTDVICDYIYLHQGQEERRPSDINKNFAHEEFTKLFQKVQETIDLIFADGIDWRAFLLSFQELQAEYGEENLSLQAIEKKNGAAFVIRLEVPPEANKSEIERQAKKLYEQKLILLETKYHTELKAKDEQIEIYRKQSADLLEITKLMANRPIQNIIDVTAKAESQSVSESSKKQTNNDLRNAQIAGGLVNADTVSAHQIGGNINNYTPQQRQNLTEAASEIQQLLQQLEQTNPTTTTSEKMTVVAKAVDEIEKNPTLKVRVIGALKSGGKEALKEAVAHPLVNILMASIEGWQEAE